MKWPGTRSRSGWVRKIREGIAFCQKCRNNRVAANTGDRPIQVGSHYHFYETNPALAFDRDAARGMRLDIAAGTAVRFEPGQTRHVGLIPIAGAQRIFGFNGEIMGEL